MGKGKSYEDIVEDIYALQKFTGRMSTQPITELMARLDDPHHDFSSVHIAGTNGKGSTALILSAILQEAGYCVGTYTSPHLVDFRERVQVNGDPIRPEQVRKYYDEIAAEDKDISFFEFTTALAFMHFAAEDVDIAIIETGIGGRLDATNILDPDVAIITNVSADHTTVLGETPEQIAYEKAGIIKEETPVVCGAEGEPRGVIEQVAVSKDADVYDVEAYVDMSRDWETGNLMLHMGECTFKTDIVADYQVENINTALTACDLLGSFDISVQDARRALALLDIEGRMEQFAEHPQVLLDGAHNPAGMKHAARTIKDVQRGRTISVVSVMGDKNYEPMLEEVESFSDLIIVSQADIGRAAAPEDLAACVEETDVEIEPDIRRTIEKSLEIAGEEDTIVFTGSLYFIGDVKWTIEEMMW